MIYFSCMTLGYLIQSYVNKEDYDPLLIKSDEFIKQNYETPQSKAIDNKDSGKLE